MYRVPTTPLKTETKGHRIRPRPFYQGLLGKFTSVSCISEIFRQINSKLRGLFLTLSTSRHCNFLSHGVALNLSFFLIWVNICFFPFVISDLFIQSYWHKFWLWDTYHRRFFRCCFSHWSLQILCVLWRQRLFHHSTMNKKNKSRTSGGGGMTVRWVDEIMKMKTYFTDFLPLKLYFLFQYLI